MIPIGQAIRNRRIERRLSQEDLATDAMLCRTHLSDVELGKALPTLKMLDKIAGLLGMSLSGLVAMAEGMEVRN